MVHLQGKLEVVVQEARNLPNLDYSKRNPDNLSDPYVVVKIIGAKKKEHKLGKTHTIDDCLNPKWYYALSAEISQEVHELRFDVKDKDRIKSEKIGSCSVPAYAFNSTRGYEGTLDLINKKGSPSGYLLVKIKFSGHTEKNEAVVSYSPSKIKGCVRRSSTKKDTIGRDDKIFVHGKMQITIHSAENLPNLDMTLFNKDNRSDPFVTASLVDPDGQEWKVATTKSIDDDLNPVWEESFPVNVCHEVTKVVFKVYDQDITTKEKIASLEIPSDAFTKTNSIAGRFDLENSKNDKCGKLTISIQLNTEGTGSFEVPDCVFPVRFKNKVHLYQDAHCPSLPTVVLDRTQSPHTPRNAWTDVQNTLKSAEKIIFITGWSVKASISLIRQEYGGGETLGRILWNKALEGVDVRLLLWDEITSTDSNQMGTMSTYDNKTKDFFKDSPVKVCLALREKKPKGLMPDSSYFTKCCYSHHQKTIIADAMIPTSGSNSSRQLVAYVGGLDLTAGRYDTPSHPLFSTLANEHKDDFYNNLVSTNAQSGPRQPWHDIHSMIIGPAAGDVLNNFTDRWVKQGISSDTALNLDGVDINYEYNGQDQWDVQIFRSISEDSVPFYNERSECLITKKGRKIDNSIQRAYIHQIQKAQRFIYVENQYFMGSSHLWENCRDIPVKNLVPLEIAAKIVEKIKEGDHFVAYIVIPMFPEGNPEDIVTQEMLHWQFHTIEMMYRMIGEAILKKGVDAVPQDYLMFFCIGKREGPEDVPAILKQPLDETAALAFKNRRSMIYVHSKMAIFDDEYILVGSANINDRSLGGTRDTEIAMGAYQPIAGQYGNGDVSTFRKCLWSEHLGEVAPLDLDPGSLRCARKVRQLAEDALVHYIDVSLPLPKSHLLIYPLQVDRSGAVSSRSDCEMFPDTKASVVGMRSKVLPTELTT